MRQHIIKRNKTVFIFVMWGIILALVLPWAYKNVFISGEGFVLHGQTCNISRDLSNYLGELDTGKNVFLDVSFLENDYIFSKLNMDDFDLGGMKVTGDIVVKGHLIEKGHDKSVFSGKLFSKKITLNSKLSMKVSSEFKIKDDTLEITSLHLGKTYNLKGTIGLIKPFMTDIVFEINRADMRDFAVIAKAKNPNIALGRKNGIFYIKGNLRNLFSNGILQSRNGKIASLEYDVANIRLEGIGPIISIADGHLRHGKSKLTLDGYMDLRDIQKGNLFEGVTGSSDMKELVWHDWDIIKSGKDELRMTKDISDYIRVGFKTMAREPLTTYYDKESPEEMSLEYKMGLKNLKMKFKENEEFFGVEHNIQF